MALGALRVGPLVSQAAHWGPYAVAGPRQAGLHPGRSLVAAQAPNTELALRLLRARAARDHLAVDHHRAVPACQQVGGRVRDECLDRCAARVVQSWCSQIDLELARDDHLVVDDRSSSMRDHRDVPVRVRRFVFGRVAEARKAQLGGQAQEVGAELPQPRVQGLAQVAGALPLP